MHTPFPALLYADGPTPCALVSGVNVLDKDTPVHDQALIAALLEEGIAAEGESAWWLWGDFALLTQARRVVEWGKN